MTSPSEGGLRKEILAARARAIAESRQHSAAEAVLVLTFRVGGERYAVAAEEVAEALEIGGMAALLGAPSWLLGAIVAQSQLVPVVDARSLLGLEARRVVDLRRVVVLETAAGLVGIAVEEIDGHVEVQTAGLSRPERGPLVWVAPDGLAQLDVTRLLGEAAAVER